MRRRLPSWEPSQPCRGALASEQTNAASPWCRCCLPTQRRLEGNGVEEQELKPEELLRREVQVKDWCCDMWTRKIDAQRAERRALRSELDAERRARLEVKKILDESRLQEAQAWETREALRVKLATTRAELQAEQRYRALCSENAQAHLDLSLIHI